VNSNSCGRGLVVFSLMFLFGVFTSIPFLGLESKTESSPEDSKIVFPKSHFEKLDRRIGSSGGDFGCDTVKTGFCHPIAKIGSSAISDFSKPKITRPLKITSQPKPLHTVLARENQIQGVVRLRVTFEANGKIGKVSPVSGLPFRLLEECISAAKAIKFEPAKFDGIPKRVTKLIEYRFNIY
jgi:outer membrane biosynthesis protein TonB